MNKQPPTAKGCRPVRARKPADAANPEPDDVDTGPVAGNDVPIENDHSVVVPHPKARESVYDKSYMSQAEKKAAMRDKHPLIVIANDDLKSLAADSTADIVMMYNPANAEEITLTIANVETILSQTSSISIDMATRLLDALSRVPNAWIGGATVKALKFIKADKWQFDKKGKKRPWLNKSCDRCIAVEYNTAEAFAEYANIIYDGRYSYDLVVLPEKKRMKAGEKREGPEPTVTVNCPAHGYFEIVPHRHITGSGCQKCARNYKQTHNEIVGGFNERFGDTLEIIDEDVTKLPKLKLPNGKLGGKYMVSVRCKVHDCTFKRHSDKLYRDDGGCSKCRIDKIIKLQTRDWETSVKPELIKIHGDKYDYSEAEFVNMDTKIKITCRTCKNPFYQRPACQKQRKGCPNCAQSNGEKMVERVLKALNLPYELEKIFPDCGTGRLRYDAYATLPNGRAFLVEYDGAFHFEDLLGNDMLTKQQENDAIKNEYARQNDIPLLRIDYRDVDKWSRDTIENTATVQKMIELFIKEIE